VLIALDLGEKRVGVAKSDALGLMAHAMPLIEFKSLEDFTERLGVLLNEIQPEKVIVGHPRTLTNETGIAAEKIEKKVEFFRSKYPHVPFELWDERLTTKEAEGYLRESGGSRRKRKQRVDSLAAQIILQTYLDTKRGS